MEERPQFLAYFFETGTDEKSPENISSPISAFQILAPRLKYLELGELVRLGIFETYAEKKNRKTEMDLYRGVRPQPELTPLTSTPK